MRESSYSILLLAALLFFATGCKKDEGPTEPEEKEDQLAENVTILPESNISSILQSISEDGSTIIFNGGSAAVDDLQRGDIIFIPHNTGYLKKVNSISKTGNTIEVTAANASLTEAVNDGTASFTGSLAKGKLSSISLDKTLYQSGGLTIESEGSLDIYYNIYGKCVYGFWSGLDTLQLYYDFTENFNLSISVSGSINRSYEKEIYNQALTPAIQFVIAGLPVWVTPVLSVTVGIDGNAATELTTGVSQQTEYEVDLEYDGNWRTSTKVDTTFSFTPPQVSSTVTAKAYLKPKMEFKVYDSVSPWLSADLYCELNANPSATPLWQLYGGVDVTTGIYIEVWDHTLSDREYPGIIQLRQLIAQGGEPASINLLLPNSSTVWEAGEQNVSIEWNSTGDPGEYVLLQLFNGSSLTEEIVNSTANDDYYGYYDVPENISASSNYRAKIQSTSDNSIYDYSDYFEITATEEATFSITNPTSSTLWETGESNVDIEWTSTGDPGPYVKLQLYEGSSMIDEIDNSTTNDGYYGFYDVPENISGGTIYRIKINSTSDNSIYDYSDYFTIEAALEPSAEVTNPNSTTVWELGEENVDIEWTTENVEEEDVLLNLFKGSTHIENIVPYTDNDGYYGEYDVPSNFDPGNDYNVQVFVNSELKAYSDYFEIIEPSNATLEITNPNSLTVWELGESNVVVEWTSENVEESFLSINLYKGSELADILTTSTYNDGYHNYYDVPVNLEPGTDYRIQIYVNANLQPFSDYFEITGEEATITVTEPNSSTVWETGEENVEIYWAKDGNMGSNVNINLYRGDGVNNYVDQIAYNTSNDGSYTIYDVPENLDPGTNYRVQVHTTDFETIGYSEDFEIVEGTSGSSEVNGYVYDATDNSSISNAYVELIKNSSIISNQYTTGSGYFSFTGLESGSYTIEVSKSGYIDNSDDIYLSSGETESIDIFLSPSSSDVDYRIVLQWGAEPEDLDAHLNKDSYHVFWDDKGNQYSFPYAVLDNDEVDGYGPETITIYDLNGDYCVYYVHNYSMSVGNSNVDIKDSDAVVKLYSGSTLINTFQVPSSGEGNYWHVIDIDESGQVIIVNEIKSFSPASFKQIIK